MERKSRKKKFSLSQSDKNIMVIDEKIESFDEDTRPAETSQSLVKRKEQLQREIEQALEEEATDEEQARYNDLRKS